MRPAKSSYSLLIADDDDNFRGTLKEIFEPRGFRTLLAADGREAIAILEDQLVDCLLFDVHMPILTGVEAVRIVRRLHGRLPCILLTADSSEGLLREALALEVFTVLNKPVSREEVTTSVDRALELAS